MPDALRNPEVEAWVLGALLDAEGPVLKRSASELIDLGQLEAEDFFNAKTQEVFKALVSLARLRQPVDAQTVFAAASPHVKGLQFSNLQVLQTSNACTLEVFTNHCQTLHKLKALRRFEAFARRLQKEAGEKKDPTELLRELETFAQANLLPQLTATGDTDAIEVIEEWEAVSRGERVAYVPTGIDMLDETVGGYVANLNVIAGQESVGKSALTATSIMSCLRRGMRVGVFGLEDATKWITKRHIARLLEMPVGKVAASRLNPMELGRAHEAAAEIAKHTQRMFVHREPGITTQELLAKAKFWIAQCGVRIIFIDHGGEITHDVKSHERHDLAVAETYRALRDLAVNHSIPVVVLAHFSSEADKVPTDGPPHIGHIAGSRFIARMARLVLGLWDKDGELRCTVLKRTEGERNVTVELQRQRQFALVNELGGRAVDLKEERAAENAAKKKAKAEAKKGSEWIEKKKRLEQSQLKIVPDPPAAE